MKNKIIRKKRSVKKKVKAAKKISSPAQWGKEFEKLAHREPVNFNFIRPKLSGDAFASQGTKSFVDPLRPFQRKVNERESDMADALWYTSMPGLQSQCSTGNVAMTRGELGTAPSHYAHGKITPWEVIDDWKLEYYCGNASKYICRHKHKGTPVQDIQKAIDCLLKYKANLEKETK